MGRARVRGSNNTLHFGVCGGKFISLCSLSYCFAFVVSVNIFLFIYFYRRFLVPNGFLVFVCFWYDGNVNSDDDDNDKIHDIENNDDGKIGKIPIFA